MRGHRDLKWVSIGAVVAALVAVLVPWEIVRLLAALPLALFLPGYAITPPPSAPRARPAAADDADPAVQPLRCSASAASSSTSSPAGSATVTWALLLVIVVIAAARAAALRRAKPESQREWARPRLRRWDLACVLVAVAAVRRGAGLRLHAAARE